MKSWKEIPGWTDFENIYEYAVHNTPSGGTLVEVGSWFGRSSAMMCEKIRVSGKRFKFFCVDIWDDFDELQKEIDANGGAEGVFASFQKNMSQHNGYYSTLRMKSVDAAKKFQPSSCDFVFIDACHDYEYVIQDIDAWLPKLKVGGIIAGHDFWKEGVRKAVNERFPAAQANGSSWIIYNFDGTL